MWLIGNCPLKVDGGMVPPHSGILESSTKTTNCMPPLLLNINTIKRESRTGHPWNQTGVLKIGCQWSQPLYCLQLLLRKVKIFYIPIHKVLEQSWRHFASLKLCKYSQISHPSTRAASTSCRWHMLRFDTSYKEGKHFFPILQLLGLICVICCN